VVNICKERVTWARRRQEMIEDDGSISPENAKVLIEDIQDSIEKLEYTLRILGTLKRREEATVLNIAREILIELEYLIKEGPDH